MTDDDMVGRVARAICLHWRPEMTDEKVWEDMARAAIAAMREHLSQGDDAWSDPDFIRWQFDRALNASGSPPD